VSRRSVFNACGSMKSCRQKFECGAVEHLVIEHALNLYLAKDGSPALKDDGNGEAEARFTAARQTS
jgi:hypothetical protein